MPGSVRPADSGAEIFLAARLERVFEHSFRDEFNTQLQGGYAEPLYQPALDCDTPACIAYSRDYFASALHEVAHWCIAGAQRRLLVDYGYWYAPDGRDSDQQRAFQVVEIKPQALEWIFAKACGYGFKISLDNLNSDSGEVAETRTFQQRVLTQVMHWQVQGLNSRPRRFFEGLNDEFGRATPLRSLVFDLEELD